MASLQINYVIYVDLQNGGRPTGLPVVQSEATISDGDAPNFARFDEVFFNANQSGVYVG